MKRQKSKPAYAESWKRNLRAWKIWWKRCPRVFLSALLHAIVKALGPYVTIYLSAQIINELAGNREPRILLKWVLLQLACSAGVMLLSGVLSRWSSYEKDSAKCLDDRIYIDKILDLDYAEIDRQAVFDLYSQVRQNHNWAGWGIYKTLSFFDALAASIMQILGGVGLSLSLFAARVPQDGSLAFLNHPFCAAAMVVLLLLIAVISPICSNKGNRFWTQVDEEVKLGNRLFGFYGNMQQERERAVDLRIYNQQQNVCGVYWDRSNIFGPGSRMAKIAKGPMGLWLALSKCASVVLTGTVYLFVCLKAWGGAFGVGSVTQYIGAITQLFLGISDLLQTVGSMRTNGYFLQSCFELLDIPNRMYQGSLTTEKRSDRRYTVEFRDVSFRYPDTDQWALRHVNIKFRIGGRLAIVGQNGSGKTTFIKLLCRLYDPTEGQILLNGIDIRKYRYGDYISIFSVVFQDFKLLALPLGENVAGSADYDRSRVWKCLRDAGLEARAAAMPKGLDTALYRELDLEGVEVSGGEAQKIAIARALYKDAPFLILDEPTAALDPIAEAEIYSRLDSITGDRTAIYISHRLSSCKFCDEIAVFDQGQIVQMGSHEALAADEAGKYAALWHAQAQYYAEPSSPSL